MASPRKSATPAGASLAVRRATQASTTASTDQPRRAQARRGRSQPDPDRPRPTAIKRAPSGRSSAAEAGRSEADVRDREQNHQAVAAASFPWSVRIKKPRPRRGPRRPSKSIADDARRSAIGTRARSRSPQRRRWPRSPTRRGPARLSVTGLVRASRRVAARWPGTTGGGQPVPALPEQYAGRRDERNRHERQR